MPFSFASCLPSFVRSKILLRSACATADRMVTTISHITVGTDPVVNKPDCDPLRVEFFYQLDHISSVAAKTVEFLHQNNITVFHFHTHQVQPLPVGRTAGCLIGKYTVCFHTCVFERPDLNIEGVLTG